jgi:hypothetical protein
MAGDHVSAHLAPYSCLGRREARPPNPYPACIQDPIEDSTWRQAASLLASHRLRRKTAEDIASRSSWLRCGLGSGKELLHRIPELKKMEIRQGMCRSSLARKRRLRRRAGTQVSAWRNPQSPAWCHVSLCPRPPVRSAAMWGSPKS